VRELASVFAQKERVVADKNKLAERVQQLENENSVLLQKLNGSVVEEHAPQTPRPDSTSQQLAQEQHAVAQLEEELARVKLAAEDAQREARHYFDQIQKQKQQIMDLKRQEIVDHLERADIDVHHPATQPAQSNGSHARQIDQEEEVQLALAELRQQLDADKERALAEQRQAFEETALAEARGSAVKGASDIGMKAKDVERLAFESKIAAAMATTEAQKAYMAAKVSGEEVVDATRALASWAYQ
jgi:hypothetical protein